MNRIEQAKDTLTKFYSEIWSKGNLELVDQLFDPSFEFILPFAHLKGVDQFKKLVTTNRIAFENLTYTVAPGDLLVEESQAAAFWTMTSKHVDTWRNVPGSNKDVSINGMTFFRFGDDGKLLDARVENDALSLMKQISGIKVIYES